MGQHCHCCGQWSSWYCGQPHLDPLHDVRPGAVGGSTGRHPSTADTNRHGAPRAALSSCSASSSAHSSVSMAPATAAASAATLASGSRLPMCSWLSMCGMVGILHSSAPHRAVRLLTAAAWFPLLWDSCTRNTGQSPRPGGWTWSILQVHTHVEVAVLFVFLVCELYQPLKWLPVDRNTTIRQHAKLKQNSLGAPCPTANLCLHYGAHRPWEGVPA
eukprot:1159680-Pelagomonas_calceolata.AAC.10